MALSAMDVERDEYDAVVDETAMGGIYSHLEGGGSTITSSSNGTVLPAEQQKTLTQLGHCEQFLSEMKEGALKASLRAMQDILVRNNTLISNMEGTEQQWLKGNREDRDIAQTRSVHTMELRNNMIELARLTAEVPLLIEAPKFRGPGREGVSD